MRGTVAVTDFGWYTRLRSLPGLEEINFWKPSAARAFQAPEFSPFLFKLRAPHNVICGFGFFARYSRLPDWLAWESFGLANGCSSLREMRERIGSIRERIRYRGGSGLEVIGCILIVQPVFFPEEHWVAAPRDWPVRTQSDKRYDLSQGEGARVWTDCLRVASLLRVGTAAPQPSAAKLSPRWGKPALVTPRLGQGTFRIGVMEAYGRACAVTEEHSLPALEAVHIRPYAEDGPHELRNGLLLRADLHRLFDRGYLAVDREHRLVVSGRLREDFANGRTYYPLHGKTLRIPEREDHQPAEEHLEFHRETVYRG